MDGPFLLAQYLEKHGITASEIARRASVHQSVVSNLLTRRRGAGLRVATAIERATDKAVPAEAWLPKLKKSKAA